MMIISDASAMQCRITWGEGRQKLKATFQTFHWDGVAQRWSVGVRASKPPFHLKRIYIQKLREIDTKEEAGGHRVPRGRTRKEAVPRGGEGGIVRITEEREKYLPPTLQEVNLGCSYPKAAKSIDWRLPVN